MKKKFKVGRATLTGAIAFFVLIALEIQVAVLVYAYISERTENKVAIAFIILAIIIGLSILCTTADVIRRRIMIDKPVAKILDATSKMTSGDFSVRLDISHPYKKYNEYDMIMDNINLLAAELEKTELLKSDFVSNVSHEIKTPLAVIQSYSTLLSKDDIDDETRKKYAAILKNATCRLSDLITNILKLNKLENQEIEPEKSNFNLKGTIEESVLGFEEIIEEKGLNLTVDLDEVKVFTSLQFVDIILNNLISNAIKFTPGGGTVGIKLYKVDRDAIIEVVDTGVGISPEVGKRIFDKFYQGDSSHAAEGNGLGLALVKKVVEILGGEIAVSSELNSGSTFKVLLKGIATESDTKGEQHVG